MSGASVLSSPALPCLSVCLWCVHIRSITHGKTLSGHGAQAVQPRPQAVLVRSGSKVALGSQAAAVRCASCVQKLGWGGWWGVFTLCAHEPAVGVACLGWFGGKYLLHDKKQAGYGCSEKRLARHRHIWGMTSKGHRTAGAPAVTQGGWGPSPPRQKKQCVWRATAHPAPTQQNVWTVP